MKEKNMDKIGSPKYWKSLEQWRNDADFQEMASQEFVSSPLVDESDDEGGWARREFLKLMGASLALTTFGCVREAQKIVPYAKRPEEIIPGLANYYASSFVDGNEAFGTVVTTREGRPIKVEGNTEHPANLGGLSSRAHAHILNLYDPDRLAEPQKKEADKAVAIEWEKLDAEVAASLKSGGVALLTGSLSSPSTKKLVNDFKRSFSAQHYVWDDVNNEDIRQGQKLSYGENILPRPRFDKASYVLSVGADFLGTYLSPVEFTKQFSKGRRPEAEMNKLVVIESLLSLTGANADERFRVKPSQLTDVVMGLLYDIVIRAKKSNYASDANVRKALEAYAGVADKLGIPAEDFKRLAEELWQNRGQSVVLAGGLQTQTAESVGLQVAVNFLNSVLGNDGKTIDYDQANYLTYSGSDKDLSDLVSAMKSGQIKTLIISGVNPVYSTSQSLKFAEALAKVATTVYVGDRSDETGKLCTFVANKSHAMEAWGDVEVQPGVYSIQQPTIRPLNKSRSFEESIMSWMSAAGKASSEESWYDYVRSYWKNNIYATNRSSRIARQSFEDFWVALLQTGVFDTSKGRNKTSRERSFKTSALSSIKQVSSEGYELALYETIGLRDGSLANVSWLQEFPDPVSKICWENYLTLSPRSAVQEGVVEGQMVNLKVNGLEKKVPVHIQPGQDDHTLGLAVGYGRSAAGQVANGVGTAAFDLAGWEAGRHLYAGLKANISKTSEKIKLACVQDHHSMEGRQIVVEATLADFKKKSSAGIHHHKVFSAWKEHEYKTYKWGMSIDLSACTGCGTCMISCQSENNIPTVGKKYILKGREMHWMRIDRYYTGTPENPGTVFQPVNCFHCDNAHCETVCPVAATTHSTEGLNEMIYNRCVGTRYCANNCAYKSRRFNWFDYTKLQSPLHMALNPEVTVRDRGVMEKCTFCNHRINAAKMKARSEEVAFVPNSVKTACQQSCPADAIVFGDMNDPASEVSKAFKDGRTYELLEELMAKPSVRFKTKIRNVAQLKGGQAHGHGNDNEGGTH